MKFGALPKQSVKSSVVKGLTKESARIRDVYWRRPSGAIR